PPVGGTSLLGEASATETIVSRSPPRGSCLASPLLRLGHARGGLAEEHRAGLVVEWRIAAELVADGPTLLHRGAARDGVPPAGDAGEVGEDVSPLKLAEDPRPRGHVGDRVLAREVRAVRQAPLQDTEEAVRLVAEPIDRVGDLLGGVVGEVVQLPGDGTEIRDLPGHPLEHVVPAADVARQEAAGLLGEVLEAPTALEARDGIAAARPRL